jgi:hypothetical protein
MSLSLVGLPSCSASYYNSLDHYLVHDTVRSQICYALEVSMFLVAAPNSGNVVSTSWLMSSR